MSIYIVVPCFLTHNVSCIGTNRFWKNWWQLLGIWRSGRYSRYW